MVDQMPGFLPNTPCVCSREAMRVGDDLYWPACECDPTERVLRCWAYAYPETLMPPMTAEQRRWCIDEIHRVEGWGDIDYRHVPDSGVAYDLLRAWVDYCRDKGLLP